jgi:hypothetical protein
LDDPDTAVAEWFRAVHNADIALISSISEAERAGDISVNISIN